MSGTFCIEFVFKNMEILPNPTESLNNREIIVTIFVIDKFRLYECFQDKFQHGRISADSAVLFRRQTFSDMRQIMNEISREDSYSYLLFRKFSGVSKTSHLFAYRLDLRESQPFLCGLQGRV